MCGCLSSAPYWGPDSQPRHVPWLGIKSVTLWFMGQHSVHWATPGRAMPYNFYVGYFREIQWNLLALGTFLEVFSPHMLHYLIFAPTWFSRKFLSFYRWGQWVSDRNCFPWTQWWDEECVPHSSPSQWNFQHGQTRDRIWFWLPVVIIFSKEKPWFKSRDS